MLGHRARPQAQDFEGIEWHPLILVFDDYGDRNGAARSDMLVTILLIYFCSWGGGRLSAS